METFVCFAFQLVLGIILLTGVQTRAKNLILRQSKEDLGCV